MTRKINTLIMATLAVVGLTFAVATFAPSVQAQSTVEACEALANLSDSAACDDTADSRVVGVARVALNILSLIVGIASVIVIVVSGFRFVVSGGDANAVQGARNGIIYAVIGLVIVVFAQAIVAFVLERVDEEPAAEARNSSITLPADTLV